MPYDIYIFISRYYDLLSIILTIMNIDFKEATKKLVNKVYIKILNDYKSYNNINI